MKKEEEFLLNKLAIALLNDHEMTDYNQAMGEDLETIDNSVYENRLIEKLSEAMSLEEIETETRKVIEKINLNGISPREIGFICEYIRTF